MKLLCALILAASALALSDCSKSHAESAQAQPVVPAARYKAGHGVQLSAGAREVVGLKTADVAEREITGSGKRAAIPTRALIRTVKGDFVYVANGPWFIRTPVVLGATDGGWFHVADGLYEGDTVVTHGTRILWLAELQAVNGGVGCTDDK